MYSKVKAMGHPLHLMLVSFPIGLWLTSVVFDLIHFITGNGYWSGVAFWMITAGTVGGLIAALAGATDWTGIPKDTRAKRVGMIHGLGNTIVLSLFVASWLVRLHAPDDPSIIAYVLSFLGAALVSGTAWLGGELTGHYGVGIEEGANVNAPNSLSRRPANTATIAKGSSEAVGDQTVVG